MAEPGYVGFVDFARALDNRTPMVVRCAALDDRHGHEVLLAVAKMTWQLSALGKPNIGHPQSRVRVSHSCYDGPNSSIRYPEDMASEKPGTDVLLLGTAQPPTASPPDSGEVDRVAVSLRVVAGDTTRLHKRLLVYGTRAWQRSLSGASAGPAEPLSPTPLRWENSYGGYDGRGDKTLIEQRNPIGNGVTHTLDSLIDQPAPAIEDPAHPLSGRNPAPAGFGPIPAHWLPRAAYQGTYDEKWRRERAPVAPVDLDARYFCSAPEGQHLVEPLRGDEAIEVLGATPEGVWCFKLPVFSPRFIACVDGQESELDTHLDTYLIDADERRVELSWRATVVLPRKSEQLQWLRVGTDDRLDQELLDDLRRRLDARGGGK
jgi:hypothetical protein